MPLTASYFIDLLQLALRLNGEDAFGEFIDAYGDIGDLILSDDGTFESLSQNNHYVVFIQQFLDCWIDSKSNPTAYPSIREQDWPEMGATLLQDVEDNRIPSHPCWEWIYSLRCPECGSWTRRVNELFRCPDCNAIAEFRVQ